MKIGVFTAVFADKSLDQALDTIKRIGVETVEIPTGGFAPKSHCDPQELLQNEDKLKRFVDAVEKRNLSISALSCHGNPLHPDENFAQKHREDFKNTVLLAEKLHVDRICLFAGCPGDYDGGKVPNWVTSPWPDYYRELLEWQWSEKIVPYWKEAVSFIKDHGIGKLCFEMHPGDAVYNPEKFLKLREAIGPEIGANLDPSHLFWQGIDPIVAIRKLGHAIYHVHIKDTKVDDFTTSQIGVLDAKSYQDALNRSWNFCTVGYGHDLGFWKNFVRTLRLLDYDYVLSIEHEDQEMSLMEGLTKAVRFLKEAVITEKPEKLWFV